MTQQNPSLRRAVFLDRDGVLNQLALNPATGEFESPHVLADLHMLPGVTDATLRLQDAGFALFIVSNQPSYSKGKTSLENIQAIARAVDEHFARAGVRIWRSLYCYHHPDGTVGPYAGACRCRKPKPQLLFDARDEFGLELSESWLIGDQDSDIECGRRAGGRTVAITNPLSAKKRFGRENATFVAGDLTEAVVRILSAHPKS